MMMSTLSWTISSANSWNRSALPSAYLGSRMTFCPSTYPSSRIASRKRVGVFFREAMCDKPDPPHLSRLLCVSSKRPRRCCADEKSDEFAPPHGIDPDAIRLKFSVEILPDLRETSKITVTALRP